MGVSGADGWPASAPWLEDDLTPTIYRVHNAVTLRRSAHLFRTYSLMIELHYAPTPNGHKIAIALEEMALPYEVHRVDIGQGDQFKPEFLAFSPNKSLTRDRDTAFLGHIGLARLALEQDDPDAALAAARTALELKPKSALAARQVMVLEAERGNWSAALPALSVVMAAGDPDDDTAAMLAHQKAALAYLETEAGSEAPDDSAAIRRMITSLQTALAAWPGFWPAALRLADLHVEAGSAKKAVKPLETAFRNMPHDSLAARLAALWNVNEGSTVARLIKLIPDDGQLADEGRRVVAAAALERGLIGEGRRLLDEIDEGRRDAAAWRLAARLAATDEDNAAETAALHRAGEAPRPRRWQCTSCQLLHGDWQSHCSGCAGFATLDWQRPDGVTPLVGADTPAGDARLNDAD